MSEMVERVARALAAQYAKECDLGADYEDGAWETYIEGASAAIEAMRQPTEDVISAGDASLPFSRGTETHRMAGGITPEGIWDAMIEGALCDHDWQENTEEEDCCSKCEASRAS